MLRLKQVAVSLCLCLLPWAAHGEVVWATWGAPAGATSTGTFVGGHVVQLAGNFTNISSGEPAGLEYTSNPQIPGRPDTTNPPFTRMFTGTPNTVVAQGVVLAAIDLTGLPSDANVVFGLADQRSTAIYRIALLDAAQNALSMAAVTVTPYDLVYNNSLGFGTSEAERTADFNTFLSIETVLGNRLLADGDHNAGGFYEHTGLTLFSELPAGTRHIVLYSEAVSTAVEAIQIYLGADFGDRVFADGFEDLE